MPLDFSGQSREALNLAVPLAGQCGGRISLIHVVEPPPVYAPSPGEVGIVRVDTQTLEEASTERLAGMARELVPQELIAGTLVRTGRAYAEIIDAADELNVDLIVIATHGYTGLKHVLLGSTAEHVVRHAHRPVLTVRRHRDGPSKETWATGDRRRAQPSKTFPGRLQWRRILVPIDFSKTSLRSLEVAAPLARHWGARLFLLSAIEPQAYAAGMESMALTVSDATLLNDAKANLPKIAKRFIPSDVKVTAMVERGRAFDVIARVAREEDMDLIVLTTHGRTGLEHLMMGSTAERVVRHAHCPVYVVRSLSHNQRMRPTRG